MVEKVLGKITSAEFGRIHDMPFLFGLQLTFDLGINGMITDGAKFTENISSSCKWTNVEERNVRFMYNLDMLNSILADAKVNHVSELKGKPVEVEIENNTFKNFRILTEVL